jgi:hypothetical protein
VFLLHVCISTLYVCFFSMYHCSLYSSFPLHVAVQ